MQKSRIDYFDIAKGIAIISVIIGHLGIHSVNRVVFTYHLPVFLFISGYFVNRKLPLKEYSVKRIKSLMIPYAVTCGIIIVFGGIRGILKGNGLQEGAKWLFASLYGAGYTIKTPFYVRHIGAIWYLPASCVGIILLRLSLQMKERVRPFMILFFFAAGYLSSRLLFWFPMSVQSGFCSTFFLYAGWLYRKHEAKIHDMDTETKIGAGIIAAIAWIMFMIQFEGFSLARNNYGRGIVDLAGAVAASILVIQISRCIEHKTNIIRKILLSAGRSSLLILCLHIIELDLFPWKEVIRRFVNISDQGYKMMMVFLKPAILLPAAWLLLKIKAVRKLFGYENR